MNDFPKTLRVRNLARDPQSRIKRRLRPGNRTGFILSDGTRLRRMGDRGTELDLKTVAENAERLADGVRDGFLEFTFEGQVVPEEAIRSLAGELLGGWPSEDQSDPDPKLVDKDLGKALAPGAEDTPPLEGEELQKALEEIASKAETNLEKAGSSEPAGESSEEPPEGSKTDGDPGSSEEMTQVSSEVTVEGTITLTAGDTEPVVQGGALKEELTKVTEGAQPEEPANEEPPAPEPSPGDTVIPAGKYQGKTLAWLMENDEDYFLNLSRNLSKHPDLAAKADEMMTKKE